MNPTLLQNPKAPSPPENQAFTEDWALLDRVPILRVVIGAYRFFAMQVWLQPAEEDQDRLRLKTKLRVATNTHTLSLSLYIYIYIYTCMYLYIYIYIPVCVCVYIYICMYVSLSLALSLTRFCHHVKAYAWSLRACTLERY